MNSPNSVAAPLVSAPINQGLRIALLPELDGRKLAQAVITHTARTKKPAFAGFFAIRLRTPDLSFGAQGGTRTPTT